MTDGRVLPDRAPLESVDRALRLLSVLRTRESVTVSQAAAELRVAPSTAHRLLAALAHRGYAVRGPDRAYRPGPELRATSAPATPERLRLLLRPTLEALHESTAETVELMVLEGTQVRYLDGVESMQPLRVTARVGDLMPAHCAAGGKALLAGLDSEEVADLYADGLPPWPTARITDLPALDRALAQTRAAGYSTNADETEHGVSAIGVAVEHHSRAVAALVVAVPSVRFRRSDVPRYRAALEEARSAAELALEAAGGSW